MSKKRHIKLCAFFEFDYDISSSARRYVANVNKNSDLVGGRFKSSPKYLEKTVLSFLKALPIACRIFRSTLESVVLNFFAICGYKALVTSLKPSRSEERRVGKEC